MKKLLVGSLLLGVSLLLGLSPVAEAGFATYDVINHPDKQVANLLPWGLVLGRTGEEYVDYFSMQNVDMIVNETAGGTGSTTVTGTIIHTQRASNIGGSILATPNQAWTMSATFNNIRYKPGFGAATPFRDGPIPRDGMLAELRTIGQAWGPDRDFLVWDTAMLQLNPLVTNPLYDRARSLVGKPNEDGDFNMLGYRLDLETGPWIGNPQFDLLTQNAWWETAQIDPNSEEYTRGDFHYALTQSTNAIPEPATMALMGMGFGGLGLMRKRKKA